MDPKNCSLFSVCDNRQMTVMDANTRKVIAMVATGRASIRVASSLEGDSNEEGFHVSL
jgi:hypothetical protein